MLCKTTEPVNLLVAKSSVLPTIALYFNVEEAMKLVFTFERAFNLDISTLFNLKNVEVINQHGSVSAKRNRKRRVSVNVRNSPEDNFWTQVLFKPTTPSNDNIPGSSFGKQIAAPVHQTRIPLESQSFHLRPDKGHELVFPKSSEVKNVHLLLQTFKPSEPYRQENGHAARTRH